jgi:hypothetical protein
MAVRKTQQGKADCGSQTQIQVTSRVVSVYERRKRLTTTSKSNLPVEPAVPNQLLGDSRKSKQGTVSGDNRPEQLL